MHTPQNNSALKEKVTRLGGCNSAQEPRARDKLFQCFKYDFLKMRYSTKSGKTFSRKEAQISVAHCKLLNTYGQNDVLGFSWTREFKDLSLVFNFGFSAKFGVNMWSAAGGGHEGCGDWSSSERKRGCKRRASMLFRNNTSVDVYYASLYHRPLCGNNSIVEGSVVELARSDV